MLEFLLSDDDSVVELLSVLRLAEGQVNVVRLLLVVRVLDFQACRKMSTSKIGKCRLRKFSKHDSTKKSRNLPRGLSRYLLWKILLMDANFTLMTGFSSALLYGWK